MEELGKLRVGDVVELIKSFDGFDKLGAVGVVKITIDERGGSGYDPNVYGIVFNEQDERLHNLEGKCARGYGFFIRRDCLKLLESSQTKIKKVPITINITEAPELSESFLRGVWLEADRDFSGDRIKLSLKASDNLRTLLSSVACKNEDVVIVDSTGETRYKVKTWVAEGLTSDWKDLFKCALIENGEQDVYFNSMYGCENFMARARENIRRIILALLSANKQKMRISVDLEPNK